MEHQLLLFVGEYNGNVHEQTTTEHHQKHQSDYQIQIHHKVVVVHKWVVVEVVEQIEWIKVN